MPFSPASQARLSQAKEPTLAASQVSPQALVCSRCSLQSRPLHEAWFYPAKLKLLHPWLYFSSFGFFS